MIKSYTEWMNTIYEATNLENEEDVANYKEHSDGEPYNLFILKAVTLRYYEEDSFFYFALYVYRNY